MNLKDITEGLKVRLRGPAEHPLRGATGAVVRVFTADEMRQRQPMDMLGDPFAWLDGQVLVSLDEPRPRDWNGRPWTPVVTVAPQDVEDPARSAEPPDDDLPAVPPGRVKMRAILADLDREGTPVTGPAVRARMYAAGFEVRRETVQRWLREDRDGERTYP